MCVCVCVGACVAYMCAYRKHLQKRSTDISAVSHTTARLVEE